MELFQIKQNIHGNNIDINSINPKKGIQIIKGISREQSECILYKVQVT